MGGCLSHRKQLPVGKQIVLLSHTSSGLRLLPWQPSYRGLSKALAVISEHSTLHRHHLYMISRSNIIIMIINNKNDITDCYDYSRRYSSRKSSLNLSKSDDDN